MNECPNAWSDGTCPKCGECHYVIVRREEYEKLKADLARVRAAARALYYAAHWKADRPVNETALWEELRDACGFEPGNAPKPGRPGGPVKL